MTQPAPDVDALLASHQDLSRWNTELRRKLDHLEFIALRQRGLLVTQQLHQLLLDHLLITLGFIVNRKTNVNAAARVA